MTPPGGLFWQYIYSTGENFYDFEGIFVVLVVFLSSMYCYEEVGDRVSKFVVIYIFNNVILNVTMNATKQ